MIEPTGNIVWRKPDNGIAVTHTYGDTNPAAERDKLIERGDVPGDWEAVALNVAIPETRANRDSWRWNGSAVVKGE